MIATYALVYLPEYVVGVFLPYSIKNERRKATFIKGPPMNGESFQPCSEFGCLIWVAWQCTIHQVIPDGVHPARLDITGDTSPLSRLTEGSGRCSMGISLPRSSCEAVASFSKASAREFSVRGTCLTCTRMNFLSNSRTFLRYRIIFSPLASYESSIYFTTNWESLLTSS